MVAIPGGTYRRGSPPTEPGRRADEGPAHLVRVRPFWLMATEVPWELYDLYYTRLATAPTPMTPADRQADAVTRPSPPYVDPTWGYGHKGYPALNVTHHAAMEFCRWLSAKTGKLYRLPTESEWEYACRADTGTAYSFGDDPRDLGDYAWYDRNSDDTPHPVGRKKPNPWGLYDMHGNVAEWCVDRYDQEAYRACPADRLTLAPVVRPGAGRWSHVARGGSWVDGPAACRSAARRGSDPSWQKRDPGDPKSLWWLTDADFVGFRVARAVDEQPELIGLRSQVTKESK
jgi:formylglycine-generating enzyme required for sulfatase activity